MLTRGTHKTGMRVGDRVNINGRFWVVKTEKGFDVLDRKAGFRRTSYTDRQFLNIVSKANR